MAKNPTVEERKEILATAAKLYELLTAQFEEEEGDLANDEAIKLIIESGYDASDSDQLGFEMSDLAQTLLMLAFALNPDLRLE